MHQILQRPVSWAGGINKNHRSSIAQLMPILILHGEGMYCLAIPNRITFADKNKRRVLKILIRFTMIQHFPVVVDGVVSTALCQDRQLAENDLKLHNIHTSIRFMSHDIHPGGF